MATICSSPRATSIQSRFVPAQPTGWHPLAGFAVERPLRFRTARRAGPLNRPTTASCSRRSATPGRTITPGGSTNGCCRSRRWWRHRTTCRSSRISAFRSTTRTRCSSAFWTHPDRPLNDAERATANAGVIFPETISGTFETGGEPFQRLSDRSPGSKTSDLYRNQSRFPCKTSPLLNRKVRP